jgi:hypothetical protein
MSRFVQSDLADNERELTTKERFENLRVTAARGIGVILNRFRSLWPLKYLPMGSIHYASVALFGLLENLEDEQNQKAFENTLIGLRALAQRWPLAKEMLQLVQLTAVQQEVKLPIAARGLLADH